jgi:hypothetical protein
MQTSQSRMRAWLLVHWLAIAGTALSCLGIFCLLPTANYPVSPRPAVAPLSLRQVRHALRAQEARLDSIKQAGGTEDTGPDPRPRQCLGSRSPAQCAR